MYITSGGAGDVGGNTQYNNHPEILKSIVQNMYVKYSVDSNTVSYDVINDQNQVIDSFSLTKAYTAFTLTPNISNVTCSGGSDGSVSLNIQGPKPPYTVEWFDGSTGLTKTGLPAGTYYAFVKNAYDCEKVFSLTIAEPAPISVAIQSPNPSFAFCDGDSLALYPSGSFASYAWSNGKSDSSILVAQIGTYGLTVTDSNECIANATNIQVQKTANPIANFGFANNNANFNFLCPDLNVDNYYWDFGDGETAATTVNNSTHLYLANGSYTVTLVVENICDSTTLSKVVAVNYYPEDTTGVQNVYVKDALNVIPNPFSSLAEIRIEGLSGNLKLELFNLVGQIVLSESLSSTSFMLDRKKLVNGTYYLKVSNQIGSYAYTTVMIN